MWGKRKGMGGGMQRVKKGREKLLGGEAVVRSERIERGGGAERGGMMEVEARGGAAAF